MPKPEGKTFDFLDESYINPSLLELFDFDSPEQYIKTETDEFSAVCPFSGLPDISYVKIEYFPTGGKCVGLKSLIYYFVSFRNVGVYQEAATKRIYNDLRNALNTDQLMVTTLYNMTSNAFHILPCQFRFLEGAYKNHKIYLKISGDINNPKAIIKNNQSDSIESKATLGEISDTLSSVYGEYS